MGDDEWHRGYLSPDNPVAADCWKAGEQRAHDGSIRAWTRRHICPLPARTRSRGTCYRCVSRESRTLDENCRLSGNGSQWISPLAPRPLLVMAGGCGRGQHILANLKPPAMNTVAAGGTVISFHGRPPCPPLGRRIDDCPLGLAGARFSLGLHPIATASFEAQSCLWNPQWSRCKDLVNVTDLNSARALAWPDAGGGL